MCIPLLYRSIWLQISPHISLQRDIRFPGLCLPRALGEIEKEPITPATASDLALELAETKMLSHDRVMDASNDYDEMPVVLYMRSAPCKLLATFVGADDNSLRDRWNIT